MCSNVESPSSPHFLFQVPPGAQQLRLPFFLTVPHLGHAGPGSVVVDGVVTTDVLVGSFVTADIAVGVVVTADVVVDVAVSGGAMCTICLTKVKAGARSALSNQSCSGNLVMLVECANSMHSNIKHLHTRGGYWDCRRCLCR